MKAKKHLLQPESPDLRPFPRFRKAIVIDENATELHITSTILNACFVAGEIRTENDPSLVIRHLANVERLSEVPELIFVNLHMESCRRMDFLREFDSLSDFIRNKCKIVVLTHLADLDEKHRVLLHPSVVRYLIKPLDVFQLREFITK